MAMTEVTRPGQKNLARYVQRPTMHNEREAEYSFEDSVPGMQKVKLLSALTGKLGEPYQEKLQEFGLEHINLQMWDDCLVKAAASPCASG